MPGAGPGLDGNRSTLPLPWWFGPRWKCVRYSRSAYLNQGSLTEEDKLWQSLLFHRSYPALGMSVQILALGWKLQWLVVAWFDDRTKGICEFRIAVIDEYLQLSRKPHSSMLTFLAICFIHASSGCGVIPATSTRRLSSWIKSRILPTDWSDSVAEVRHGADHAVIAQSEFSLAIRTTNCSISSSILGGPGYRRDLDPSNLRATNFWYQPKMLSGLSALATSSRALRPRWYSISASVILSPSVSRNGVLS